MTPREGARAGTRLLGLSVLALVAAIVVPGLRKHGGLTLRLFLACLAVLFIALLGEVAMRRLELRAAQRGWARLLLSALLLALALDARWHKVLDWRPQLLLLPIGLGLLIAPVVAPRLRLPAVALLVGIPAWVRIAAGRTDPATGLLLLLAFCLALALAAEVGMALFRVSPPLRTNLRVLLVTSSLLLLGLESGLRLWTTRYSSYPERNGADWYSPYRPYQRGLHVYSQSVISFRKPEFTHTRRISKLGLTDRELPADRAPGDYRILALGDSFTEGLGTSVVNTWPRVLERELSARLPGERFVALNAGISASDPVFEYMLFKEKLQPFQPDLVVVATNSSDVEDVVVRGGMERFRADGSVRFREPPRSEWLYGRSYLWRGIVHELLRRDPLLLSGAERAALQRAAIGEVRSAVLSCRVLCRKLGARLVVVAHPMDHEVKGGRYTGDFELVVRALEGDPALPVIDLLKRYREGPITAASSSQFYWPIDLHHNTRGYAVMGGLIASELLARGLVEPAAQRR